jgi:transcriptional regulator with XRE-family HTH domain
MQKLLYIKEHRKKDKLSIVQLARAAQVSIVKLLLAELNIDCPTDGTLERIAEVLRLHSIMDLYFPPEAGD